MKCGYKPGFICDCGYHTTDKNDIKEHVTIPVEGMELQVGQIFGVKEFFDDYLALVGKNLSPRVIVLGKHKIVYNYPEKRHIRHNLFYSFGVSPDFEIPPKSTSDVLGLNGLMEINNLRLQESLCELSDGEYGTTFEAIKKMVESSDGMNFFIAIGKRDLAGISKGKLNPVS